MMPDVLYRLSKLCSVKKAKDQHSIFFRKTYEKSLSRVPIGWMMKPVALVRMDYAGNIIHPTGHCQHLSFN